MKISTYSNRTLVTFNVVAYGEEFTRQRNEIYRLCKRYNAQEMLFANRSCIRYNTKGEAIGYTTGNSGGTITFHSHSCDHAAAAAELVALLRSFGHTHIRYFKEVICTHRADGTAYKLPQRFIEEYFPETN